LAFTSSSSLRGQRATAQRPNRGNVGNRKRRCGNTGGNDRPADGRDRGEGVANRD